MAGDTVYNVRVRYDMEDKASKGLGGIAAAADKAHDSTLNLKHAIHALGLYEGVKIAKEALIDFNSEMDKLKIGMTTVMQMNMHMPFEKASAAADKLFDTFQDMAKKSPLMTKDFMQMASALAPAISMAGGDVHKLEKFTQGALTAGLAFNVAPEQMAMDVQEMLAGNVRLTSRTARQLLSSQGIDHDEFNKKSASERAQITEKIFTDPALLKASERASHTLVGETSTLKDNIEIAFGTVGRPLMDALTAQVKQWNDWIEQHPKLIAETISQLKDMITGAFTFVQQIGSWLFEHRDLLMTIGKTFLVFKGAQLGTNIFKSFVGGMTDLSTKMKDAGGSIVEMFRGGSSGSLGGAFSSLVGIITGGGGVISALVGLGGAIGIATALLNTHAEADRKARDAKMDFHEAVGQFPELLKRRSTLQEALAGKGAEGALIAGSPELRERYQNELATVQSKLFDKEKLGTALRAISEDSEKHGGSSFKNLTIADMQHAERMLPNLYEHGEAKDSAEKWNEIKSTLDLFNKQSMEDRREIMKFMFPDQWGTPQQEKAPEPDAGWKGSGKPDINVTIQRIEVASEDPDRFVFGLAKIGEQAAKNPTQSQHAIPGGF